MFSDNAGIFYERHIGREKIILMHGWGASGAAMKQIFDFLSRWNYDVINVDLPGFGRSEKRAGFDVYDYAETVNKLVEELGLKEVTLIGHSFGGRLAMILAGREWVKRIVLIDAAGLRPKRSLRYRLAVARYKRAKRRGKELSSYGSADYRALDDDMKKVFVKVVNEHLDNVAAKIDKPCAIFWGENDKETPLYMAKRLRKLIAGSKLYFLKGGHFAYAEDFAEFSTLLLSELKGE